MSVEVFQLLDIEPPDISNIKGDFIQYIIDKVIN